MSVVTKKDVLDKMICEENPVCPHCGKEMVIWECPPVGFSDGLGWGTPYLYVCFNDECSMYVKGWDNLMENFAQVASYRCICDPMAQKRRWDCMPVFSAAGGKGSIVDEAVREREEALKKAQREGLAILEKEAQSGNVKSVLDILLDDTTPPPVAFRAAELMGAIGGLDAVEPLRSHRFKNDAVQEKVDAGIGAIHERHYTKECPFCAEIIKSRAVVCKHCGKDLPKAD